MLTKKEFLKDIDKHLKLLEKRDVEVYMSQDTKDAEVKYVRHNIDRYYEVVKELENIINIKQGKIRLLDIGTSPLTYILKRRYKDISIDTIDISDHHRILAKKAGIGFKKVDLNKNNINLGKNKYDIILFLEVLEHLSGDHKEAMSSIIASMKKGGKCIIQTPNKFAPKALFVSFVSIDVWDKFTERPEINPEFAHFKEYSLGELVSFLNSFPDINVEKSEHSLYFDTISSTMVYHEGASWLKYVMKTNYLIAKWFPFLRRGMQLTITKI